MGTGIRLVWGWGEVAGMKQADGQRSEENGGKGVLMFGASRPGGK